MLSVDGKLLGIGDNVDLYTGKGVPYRTKLEDTTEEGHLVVSTPLYRGIPIVLLRGQRIQMYFYRETGRFCVEVKVHGFDVSGLVKMIHLEVVSEVSKQQRRGAFRLRKKVDVEIRHINDGPFPEQSGVPDSDKVVHIRGTTDDISETGAGIRMRTMFEEGERFYLKFWLDTEQFRVQPFMLLCEVMQHERMVTVDGTVFRVGVQFMNNTAETRTVLAKYIIDEQLRVIKKQRLMEDQE